MSEMWKGNRTKGSNEQVKGRGDGNWNEEET